MMSDDSEPVADTGSDGEGDTPEPDSADGVERVVDALAPFIEQADHLGGFAVKYASARTASRVDRSTVEVRFYFPHRHPKEVDMARGMLQGNGFDPEKKRRGGESTTCIYLSVDVDPSGAVDEPHEPRDDGEQSTF